MNSFIATRTDGSEVQVKLVLEDFTIDSPAHLNHLKLHESSGMACWLSTAGTQKRTWTGLAPVQCVVAYDEEGNAIGWCALGYFRKGTDVIGTYVLPEYRRNSIGTKLIEMTLEEFTDKQETIAFDECGWDIIHILRKHDINSVSFHDICWNYEDRIIV